MSRLVMIHGTSVFSDKHSMTPYGISELVSLFLYKMLKEIDLGRFLVSIFIKLLFFSKYNSLLANYQKRNYGPENNCNLHTRKSACTCARSNFIAMGAMR